MDDGPRSERLRLRFVRRSELPLLNARYAPDPGGFNDFGEGPGPDTAPHQRPMQAPTREAPTREAPTREAPTRDAPPREPSGAPGAADRELRDAHGGQLWVEPINGGPALGTIQYHQLRYGGNAESMAWMIGIDLVPAARGHGYGAEAQQLLADWLLDTTPVNRVEAQTDVENLAEIRALERAGFTREGTLRGAQFRGGAFHDLVVFSRLRSDPR